MPRMAPTVEIYSDGSCEGNPGRGGWAALLRSEGHERVITGAEAHTTNNRMELTAALRSLQALKQASQIEFYTDSQYLRRGITEWLPGWQARGWKRKEGALANADLWKELAEAIRRHKIDWRWVKGHAGHAENARVDRLAREAMLRG
jgi:ribonuclease HI